MYGSLLQNWQACPFLYCCTSQPLRLIYCYIHVWISSSKLTGLPVSVFCTTVTAVVFCFSSSKHGSLSVSSSKLQVLRFKVRDLLSIKVGWLKTWQWSWGWGCGYAVGGMCVNFSVYACVHACMCVSRWLTLINRNLPLPTLTCLQAFPHVLLGDSP